MTRVHLLPSLSLSMIHVRTRLAPRRAGSCMAPTAPNGRRCSRQASPAVVFHRPGEFAGFHNAHAASQPPPAIRLTSTHHGPCSRRQAGLNGVCQGGPTAIQTSNTSCASPAWAEFVTHHAVHAVQGGSPSASSPRPSSCTSFAPLASPPFKRRGRAAGCGKPIQRGAQQWPPVHSPAQECSAAAQPCRGWASIAALGSFQQRLLACRPESLEWCT